MRGLIKNILGTLFFVIFCPIYLVFSSFKYIVTGKGFIGKLAIIAGYAGLIALAVFKPIVFWILMAIFAVCDIAASIYMTRSESTSKGESSEKDNAEYRSTQGRKIPFFDGMTVEEAKKEYRKLMKQYHPDNVNGDAEMSKRVSAAYSQFCAAYGR